MKKIALVSLAAATTLFGAAYKIPENSINSTALSAAYIANAHGADASYHNPANMAFEESHALEADIIYIGLSGVDFSGNVGGVKMDGSSKSESFIIPSLHYIAPKRGDITFGFSLVVPGGLSKRWDIQPAKSYAKEFTLEVVELNPTIAYKINDTFAIGGGLRIVHSSGLVQSQSTASRDMDGDSWDFGFNLALAYRPNKSWKFAATYRSNIDLTETGSAKLYFPDGADFNGKLHYSGDAAVTVPLPASLDLAVAYTFASDTTVEFVYGRTFWSAYSELDFEYERSIGALAPKFDDPIDKDWDDANAFRLGVTQVYEKWTAMAGVAYDETPIPEKTLNFELPDSDAWIVSVGAKYAYDAHWSFGAALLLDTKESRTIDGGVNEVGIDGEFTDARAYLLAFGLDYRF